MLQKNNIETEGDREINAEQVIVEDIAHDETFSHTPQLSKTPSACNKPAEKKNVSQEIGIRKYIFKKEKRYERVQRFSLYIPCFK